MSTILFREPSAAAQRHPRPRSWCETAAFLAALGGLVVICALIIWHIYIKFTFVNLNTISQVYTVLICTYVLSRFALAGFYRAPRDVGLEPSVAIIVPAFNEGSVIARTIHACRAVDYPADKLETIVINDGSADDTWPHMLNAASQYSDGTVKCLNLGSNKGKRAAMAAGIRATSAEILVFVDSDSLPGADAVRKLVQGFVDPRVGAISGLTYVKNSHTNLLTRIQWGRYYVSYQLLKRAESVLGATTCCSGCFSAYRRTAVANLLDAWENQRFLGVLCTYGDDRALTNRIIKNGWLTRYDARAEAWTDAPDTYRKFFRQQLRWKKSWAREGPILLSHVWRSRPLACPSIALQTITGLLSPVVLIYNASTIFITGIFPTIYVVGLLLIAMAYALFCRLFRNDDIWFYAFISTVFFISLSPQLLWAVTRLRDGSWGTRALSTPADQNAAIPTTPSAHSSAPTLPEEA